MMQRPLVNGYTKDKQPYSVTARTAAQDVTKPDTIELAGNPRDSGHRRQGQGAADGAGRVL